jgi:hypothetical protein
MPDTCRRYNNVLMDEDRKMQAEIFLGLKNRVYFPTLYVEYRSAGRCGTALLVPWVSWGLRLGVGL